ncbi:hypothetical protein AMS68_007893 [Peltaster fructicola]|uniref:Allergen n=1 Tax=Peltaster fructicola TaxID=286661 RepID=A0A6H0Y5X1_9PEZI|nr:hypothetical protein AMS68_007893 [Peltaster fructicola]
MESAKNAVKDFLGHHNKHSTEVHSQTAPAVTNETVTRTNDERVTTAIDKEVHQDHHHTTIQPVKDQQVKAEQHHHNVVPVEQRSFEHDNADHVKSKLAAEAAQFKDTSRTVEGGSTTTAAPTVAGEHHHHHVHETVQPVIQRETIEPHITHTTVPVHEVHHNASKHHETSTLPAVSIDEFKSKGGSLTGSQEHHTTFAGEPKLAQHLDGASGQSTTGASGNRAL